MNFGSVCSGIEAASVAWRPLGWRAAFFSEIDPFPCAVLAHHYPDTPNRGDMTAFKDWPDATLDVLCGGTPCQSFSNAGLRAGLDDPRGQLMLTFGAIAARYRPRWLVWENVPGVLSSNGGRDFGAFLGLLGYLGYGFAYRVLDAQYVRVDGYARAVPQRRRRVFVVGCLGDWRSAAAVLSERESLRGDPAPRRQARSRVAATLIRGAESSGKGGYAGRRQEDDVNIVAGSLTGAMGRRAGVPDGGDTAGLLLAFGGNNARGPIEVSTALTALTAHGGAGRMDFESETFIAHTLRADGFDASEDGTGRGTPLVPVGVDYTNLRLQGDISGTLEAAQSKGNRGQGVMMLPFDTTQITSAANRSNPKPGDPCHPLAAGAHAPAIAFDARQSDVLQYGDATGPLDTDGHSMGIQAAAAVRRLTPTECERLMGFPPIADRIILDVCIDHQSGTASVGLQCLRWQSSASPADGSGLTPFAASATVDSSMRRAGHAPLAVLHVLPHSDGEAAQIRSRARSGSSASGVNGFDWSHQAALPADSAHSLARTLRDLALSVRSGKAASRLHMLLSTTVPSGDRHAQTYGGETVATAGDAQTGQSAGTFTTSELGQLLPISDSTEATLCCSAMAAIAGCIPSETLPARFSLELTVVTNYTAVPFRGKPAADGPRYKALGNSWAVNCARWIGRRIEAVEQIKGGG